MAIFLPLELNNIRVVISINSKYIDPQSANIEFFLYADEPIGRGSAIKKVSDGPFGYHSHNTLHPTISDS